MLLQHPINKPPNITPLLLILPLLLPSTQSADPPQRHTKAGEVHGVRLAAPDGRYVDAFLGIPYARPPVGDLRFRRPEPAEPWTGFRDASKLPASCFQEKDMTFGEFHGSQMWNPNTLISEDCLYLNVWQPVNSAGEGVRGKAVMVWIYGGSFNTGTSTLPLYDGRIMASKGDVIVVSLQYRLGPFGFLYLGNTDAPGNMGLLDQNLALRWVHDNIESFGGDPRRVTLFGESAGAASISLHLLSPLTKDLVNSAILQSASGLGYWAYDDPVVALKRGHDLAQRVGCRSTITTTSSTNKITDQKNSDIITCLKGVTASSLSIIQFDVVDDDPIPMAFTSTLDGHFLTQSPTALLHNRTTDLPLKVKLLAGVNRNEGYYFLAYENLTMFPVKPHPGAPLSRTEYKEMVRSLFMKHERDRLLSESIIFEYGSAFRYTTEAVNYRDTLDSLLGDASFVCGVVEFAQAYADAGQHVYLYQFNHRTSANPWPEWMGVMHGYEIDHVFGQPMNASLTYREEERRLSAGVVSYWTNFAKSGNPNTGDASGQSAGVTWPRYTTDERKILFINTTGFSVSAGLRDRQCEYWKTVVPQLRQYARDHPARCHATFLTYSSRSVFFVAVTTMFFTLSRLFRETVVVLSGGRDSQGAA